MEYTVTTEHGIKHDVFAQNEKQAAESVTGVPMCFFHDLYVPIKQGQGPTRFVKVTKKR